MSSEKTPKARAIPRCSRKRRANSRREIGRVLRCSYTRAPPDRCREPAASIAPEICGVVNDLEQRHDEPGDQRAHAIAPAAGLTRHEEEPAREKSGPGDPPPESKHDERERD